MMLSVVHPNVRNIVNGKPYQVTAPDYVLVNHLDLRGTFKLEEIAYWSALRGPAQDARPARTNG